MRRSVADECGWPANEIESLVALCASVCIKQQSDMPRTEVCVRDALEGKRFTCFVRENGRRVEKGCQVLLGSSLHRRHQSHVEALFRGMGQYMVDANRGAADAEAPGADASGDSPEVAEALDAFVKMMNENLHEDPEDFLFLKVESALVGYVCCYPSRFGGYYIQHIFCAEEGLNLGKLLLALAEERAFQTGEEECFLNCKPSKKLLNFYRSSGYRESILEEYKIVRHALDPVHNTAMVKPVSRRQDQNKATEKVAIGAKDDEHAALPSRATDARFRVDGDLLKSLRSMLVE